MLSLKNHKADLKAKYSLHLEISLILTLAMLVAAFKFSPNSDQKANLQTSPQDLINIEEIISTIQKPEIPPPPKPPQIITTTVDEVTEEIEFETTEIFPDENIPLPPPPRPEITDEPQIFEWSEVMPEPIGGLAAIQSKVKYTEIAKRIGLEGKVIIEAVIDETGNVIDAIVLRGLSGGLNESALLAVKETKFSPGMQRGKPVRVKLKIPIKFVLR